MKVICIMCPRGCELEVAKGKKITVTGNACPRGVIYGEREVTSPERMVTTIKKYGTKTITLKTDRPVPKDKVLDVLKEVKRVKLPKALSVGDSIIKNVCDSDSNVVVTNINS